MVGCALLMSLLGYRQFEQSIAPAVNAKVDTLAQAIEAEIGRALDYGIPFDKLQGVPEYFDMLNKSNPEVYGIRLLPTSAQLASPFISAGYADAEGREECLIRRYPLMYAGERLGTLEVLVDGQFAQKKSLDLLLDVLTVIVVSVIIAFELVIFIVSFNISARLQRMRLALQSFVSKRIYSPIPDNLGDELGLLAGDINARLRSVAGVTGVTAQPMPTHGIQRVDFIRWPFFLLIFAESLSLSFFPFYAGDLQMPGLHLSRELLTSLPISIFMLVWALSLPGGGVWSDSVGRRRAFMVGAILTAIGLVLTAFAMTFIDLLLWRSITAVGYGLVFITVQGFVTDHTDAGNRNKGMATFVATFFAGSLSGAAIGGILADHIRMPLIFIGSAIVSLGAAFFVARFIVSGGGQPRPRLSMASVRDVCMDRGFLMVTLFSAIPSKIALTGFLYFSTPLFLNHLEASKSTTGRIIMLYGLVIICLSPFVADYADRLRSRLPLILGGGLLGAAAIAELSLQPDLMGMMISIGLLGLAHAISVPSQLTFITETNPSLCERLGQGQVVGIFRLMERLGNILGPLIAGLFIAHYGLEHAFIYLAMLIGSATLVLALWILRQRLPGSRT